jgi:hypothetical protein
MIRRVKLYARVAHEGDYTRIPVSFDRNGRPLEVKPKAGHVTTYQMRIAGGDLQMAVTRPRQEQARLAEGVQRTEAVPVAPPVAVVESVPGKRAWRMPRRNFSRKWKL